MQYEVIDNYLPKEQFEAIRGMMMDNKELSWFYVPDVTEHKVEIEKTMYFSHLFYDSYRPTSQFLSGIYSLIQKLNPKALIRVKGNLYPNIGERRLDVAHKDYPFEHKGAIYYVNTNNGPTVLDDGTEIEAVENRILFFEPHKMHNSFYCTDQKVRVNININYF
jgi:hypothetical protein